MSSNYPVEPVVDAHVHLMPERLTTAIRKSLHKQTGWEISQPATREGIEKTLREAGIERYLALPYAHKPGIARDLNEWLLSKASESEMIVPFATVHGNDDVEEVVREAFEAGSRGLKFHCPVQRSGPADDRLEPAFQLAAAYNRPILFHAGTAPLYKESPYVGAEQFEEFLASYPEVKAASAHMGTYEWEAFVELTREYDNAFLDTCFAMSTEATMYMNFDPTVIPDTVFEELSGSIMYGSDFPQLPYSYSAEREGLLSRDLSKETYRDIFERTVSRFLGEV